MKRFSRAAAMVALVTLSVAACRKQPVVDPAPPVTTTEGRGGGGAVAPGNTSTPVREVIDSTPIIRALNDTRANLLLPIYFAYDAADLSMEARANLDVKVAIMRANAEVRIRIEGHCDSRGSTEYNIALGMRRAAEARQYLIDRGIAAARIETVSLGEERPAVTGESETAWARNRRDEFGITQGRITVPVGN
jgi:peptidoglycan-associated lipoprotein